MRGDLHALCEQSPDLAEDDFLAHDAFARIIAAAINDPQLAEAMDELGISRSHRRLEAIFARAAARGEIDPDRDWSFVYDIPLGMSLVAALKGEQVDLAYIHRIFDTVVLPLVGCPPIE